MEGLIDNRSVDSYSWTCHSLMMYEVDFTTTAVSHSVIECP